MPAIQIPRPDLDRLEAIAVKLEREAAPLMAAEVRAALAEIKAARGPDDPRPDLIRRRCPRCGHEWCDAHEPAPPDIRVAGDTCYVDLMYPRVEGNVEFIEVGLCDVRAADEIRIGYDFDRDGWRVEQASVFEWPADDPVCDRGWREVAFVPAWQFEGKREVS